MSTAKLKAKRLWSVSDLALWVGISHKAALTLLKQLDVETGGMLLRKGTGKRPSYTFFVAGLARSKPEIFEKIEGLEGRVDLLEEQMAERVRREKLLASQTGSNTREIVKLQTRRAA